MGTKVHASEQMEYIRREYKNLHCKEMAANLGIKEKAVRHILSKLGIKLRESGKLSKSWRKEEIEILSRPDLTDYEKVKLLPERTDASVRVQRRRRNFKSRAVVFNRQFEHLGYTLIRKNNGYVRRCRDVAETMLDRELDANESVHHINGIKSDDRPENLWVCTRGCHSTLHSQTMALIHKLMETGIVEFDREKGEYVLCQNLQCYHSKTL